LWFQIFGYFPGPALWLPCLVHVALYRTALETVIYSYLTALVLASLTVLPEENLMIVCLALSLSVQAFKRRFYWSSSSYLMLVCGLSSLAFHVYHFTLTFFVGTASISNPRISDWLIEALLTPLIAPLLMPIFRWFDKITNREQSIEGTAQIL
jgi:cell shape-determining protein MreD